MILDNFLPNNSNDGFDHSLPRLPATDQPQKTNDELKVESEIAILIINKHKLTPIFESKGLLQD